jgi:hypothetical protein
VSRPGGTVTYDRDGRWWKRAISIALAQFVAIQLMLTATVAAQMVAAPTLDAATLCVESPSRSEQEHRQNTVVVHHGFCAVCAFAAHATPLPAAITVHYEGRSFALVLRSDWSAVAAHARQRDPRSSQGPPVNV